MRIDSINSFVPRIDSQTSAVGSPSSVGSANGTESFGSTLKSAVSEVNGLQVNADNMAAKLATGDIEDVHQAMVAMQKASLALQFTVQVRNKVIDAYTEIMRTQV